MSFRRVAIIGTDVISVSIALGLKKQKDAPEISGYAADNRVEADLARARGAFDRVERKPERACRDADLVIVAVPIPTIRETFAAIAPSLQPGCLVTDTARLKGPVLDWAREILPENVSFAGGHPIPNPAAIGLAPLENIDDASADLLKDALYCFTTAPGRSGGGGAVIDACSALARALDARPFFIDVTEHDGLQSGVEGLPDLLTIALLRATVDTPGWQEMRKFAGHRFAAATQSVDDAHERHTAIFLNRENIRHRLDVLLGELMRLRDLLSQDDADLLEDAFIAAAEGRARWIGERERGMWVKEGAVSTEELPSAGKQLGQMLFGERSSRRRK
jgi:prephenate dehydrogenase